MELTSRQIEFVEKLLDLYEEIEESIHYSVVADRLGVSRSTAYEMLRLLERKGYHAGTAISSMNRAGRGARRCCSRLRRGRMRC